MTPTRRPGFTLIELFVVLAILAIITAVLFPVFAHVREWTRQTTCASNLRQIGVATMPYLQDNNEMMFPKPCDDDAGGKLEWSFYTTPGLHKTIDRSRGLLGTYLKSDAVWVCPTSDLKWLGTSITAPYPAYGLNFVLPATNRHPARTLTQVEAPSETILATDSAQPNLGSGLIEALHIFPPSRHQPAVCGRHSGQANVLWLDGHVTARKLATAYWSKGFMGVATQERLHLGDVIKGPYTGDVQADDYYLGLTQLTQVAWSVA